MKKIIAIFMGLVLALSFAGFSAASGASSLGGRLAADTILRASQSPYELTSTLEVPRGMTLTVEPGVELIVRHAGTVFRSAGTVELSGTEADPVVFTGRNSEWADGGMNTIWETAGDWQNPSRLVMRHVIAKDIRGIFTNLNQGQSIVVQDSIFTGKSGSSLRRPNFAWITFCAECVFERNVFSNLPGFRFSSREYWDGEVTLEPSIAVNYNLFIGNSTSRLSFNSWSRFGEWITADILQAFSGNSFVNFSSPVIEQYQGNTPWSITGNYFDGKTAAEMNTFVTSGLTTVATVASVLEAPDSGAPTREKLESKLATFYPPPVLVATQRTLATFSSNATILSSLQRSQVKAAVEANPNATKFICTGIRYVSQPMSENIKVRKRAKAACDYAKILNPELSTWYQNKPTEARSYAGKVLLTIKSPAN